MDIWREVKIALYARLLVLTQSKFICKKLTCEINRRSARQVARMERKMGVGNE